MRLASDAISVANVLHAYLASGDGDYGSFWSRAFARREQEIAQTVIYFAEAAAVEVSARVWRRLRAERLAKFGASA